MKQYLYMIYLKDDELDIFINSLKELIDIAKINDISFLENIRKTKKMTISAFHIGLIMASITEYRKKLPDTWKQLRKIWDDIKKEEGAKTTDLGNNMIKIVDNDGNMIIREKYDWENE